MSDAQGADHPGADSTDHVKNKGIEVHPMAFTIEFHDRKVDESRQLRIHERLSSFALKHRRNPSLPDFGVVKNSKLNSPTEKLPSPLNFHHVPVHVKASNKSPDRGGEAQAKKRDDKEKIIKDNDNYLSKISQSKMSPIELRKCSVLPSLNGVNDGMSSYVRQARRSSLNDIDSNRLSCQGLPIKVEFKLVRKELEKQEAIDCENKSDTVSEAGTYTVDKDEDQKRDLEDVQKLDGGDESEDDSQSAKENSNFHHKWINDWVNKVAEQNLLHPVDPPVNNNSKSSGSEQSSPSRSKIPSPVSTLSRFKERQSSTEEKPFCRMNGSFHHRRSSSLSAKDYSEHRGTPDAALDTESFLRTTESVMTAMQNRMRLSLDLRNSELRKSDRRDYSFRERPHPPSTASDTDTNSESEGKLFKKPLGNPFTSARLNRAFSLRRAKADPEGDESKKKIIPNGKDADGKKASVNAKPGQNANSVKAKPPVTAPFSRMDCGRFSMRSTGSTPKFTSPIQKKDSKKANSNNRSNSSLSSREVEFQNWKRRKSFDPMKAAAEGRKKELAKKAAMNNQGLTQSVNLGSGAKTRSGNPVLRSASFHSTPQALASEEDEHEDSQEILSTDDWEESVSSWASNQPLIQRASPARVGPREERALRVSEQNGLKFTKLQNNPKNSYAPRVINFSSRCSVSSIVSETHSSPSHRVRSEVLDNLVMTAINDLSYKLKAKSSNLMKKLLYVYEADEDRAFRLRDEIAHMENRNGSNSNSPIHQTASRDLSNILKNLKSMENFLKILDDVLFDENLEVLVGN